MVTTNASSVGRLLPSSRTSLCVCGDSCGSEVVNLAASALSLHSFTQQSRGIVMRASFALAFADCAEREKERWIHALLHIYVHIHLRRRALHADIYGRHRKSKVASLLLHFGMNKTIKAPEYYTHYAAAAGSQSSLLTSLWLLLFIVSRRRPRSRRE